MNFCKLIAILAILTYGTFISEVQSIAYKCMSSHRTIEQLKQSIIDSCNTLRQALASLRRKQLTLVDVKEQTDKLTHLLALAETMQFNKELLDNVHNADALLSDVIDYLMKSKSIPLTKDKDIWTYQWISRNPDAYGYLFAEKI